MFSTSRATLIIGFVLLTTYMHAQSSLAERELQAGLTAYQNANFVEAIERLERAVQLDPASIESHFALAEAYSAEYVESPNVDYLPNAEEIIAANNRLIYRAVEEYRAVFALDPSSTKALNSIGHIYFQRRSTDAGTYFRESLKIDPNNEEALYSLAVLNWSETYQRRMERRSTLKIKNEASLITSDGCAAVRLQNLNGVDEAITLLTRLSAISNYAEVPAWLSLLYRERADIQCSDGAARKADLRSATHWLRRACTARASDVEHVPYPWPPAPPPSPAEKSCVGR